MASHVFHKNISALQNFKTDILDCHLHHPPALRVLRSTEWCDPNGSSLNQKNWGLVSIFVCCWMKVIESSSLGSYYRSPWIEQQTAVSSPCRAMSKLGEWQGRLFLAIRYMTRSGRHQAHVSYWHFSTHQAHVRMTGEWHGSESNDLKQHCPALCPGLSRTGEPPYDSALSRTNKWIENYTEANHGQNIHQI